MKKQKKQLVILSIVLVGCLLTYFFVRIIGSMAEKKEEEASAIPILSISQEEVTGFSFFIGGEEYYFDREGKTWVCRNDPSRNLDPAVMEVKAGYLENLEAKEKINSKENMDDMGLEDPAGIVTIYTEEKDYEILLGNYNWLLTGYYISYEDQIYLISAEFYRAFTCSLDSMTAESDDTEESEIEETSMTEEK